LVPCALTIHRVIYDSDHFHSDCFERNYMLDDRIHSCYTLFVQSFL